jgi:hypothetical protein
MGIFRQIKNIFIVLVLIVVAILGFSYWEELEPRFNDSSEKIADLQDLLTKAEDVKDSIAGVETQTVYVVTDEAEFELEVEVADSDTERAKGLMYRENLCEYCGMLFIFSSDTENGFWMKDCYIPLDIIFVSEQGEIVDIKRDFEPCDEDQCPSYSPDQPYRYAVEVNSGWCDEKDVNIGDKVVGIKSRS